jgi:hypothetical protein
VMLETTDSRMLCLHDRGSLVHHPGSCSWWIVVISAQLIDSL